MVKDSPEGKNWIHTLFFNAFFEDALAKKRAATGLGETYAIFNALNEHWYQEGFMTEEGYEYNREKYSNGIVEEFRKKILKAEIKQPKRTEEETRVEQIITTVFKNWDGLSRDQLAAVESVQVTTTTTSNKKGDKEYTTKNVKFKLHSKTTAIEQLGRHLGVFAEDNNQRRINILAPIIEVYGNGERTTQEPIDAEAV